MTEFAWECECGNIEYSNVIPEDCPKCLAIGSFTQLPEELITEREKSAIEDTEEEMSMPKMKVSKPGKTVKSRKSAKPALKKPGRKKRK